MPLSALKLDPEFLVELDMTLENGDQARLGSIRGRRSRLTTTFEPRIEPIGLTALGRTGSTAVTRLVAAHPEVVAYRPFEYEPRVMTYWLDLLQDLSDPAAFRRQVQPQGPLDPGWWTGARPPYPRRLVDDELQALLGGETIDELALFAQRRIERFYDRAAELEGRPGVTRFVEKLGPRTGALMRELYPGAREIVLVRDFRDMVASVFAFNRKRGFQGFGRARTADDVEYVATIVADSVEMLAEAWRARSGDAFLLRYEDLVQAPDETVRSLLEHLELERRPGHDRGDARRPGRAQVGRASHHPRRRGHRRQMALRPLPRGPGGLRAGPRPGAAPVRLPGMSGRGTIAVAGSVAQRPFNGGHTWVFLQYLLGLRQLGWDVLLLDRLEPEMCVDAQGRPADVEHSVNVAYLDRVFRAFGLGDRYAVFHDGGRARSG